MKMQLKEQQTIEAELIALGWKISTTGNSHGMTISGHKDLHQIVVYSSNYLTAWQALANGVRDCNKPQSKLEVATTV